jgi:dihydroflavonol-4-reductase
MRCLVTGATGFLGTNLVHELVRDGWSVRAFGLPGSQTRYIRDLPVDIVLGDVTSPADVDRAVAGMEVVFHVAGDTSFWKRNFARQRLINCQGPVNVAEACLRHGVRRLVHTSTVDALGYNPEGLADEQWPTYNYANTGYNYADTKREGELRVLCFNATELEVVVINPGSMMGPFDHTLQFGRLFFDLRHGRVPGVPKGGAPFAHVREVARAHIVAARKGSPGQRYICGGLNITYRELFEAIAAKFGTSAPRLDIPRWAFVLYGHVMELISEITRTPPEMNPGQARYMTVYPSYDSSKAVRGLDFRIVPLARIVDDAYDWYKDNGYL